MNNYSILWDQAGKASYCISNNWLVNFDGDMVGFIERDGSVYDMHGHHTGWYIGGILRDRYGYCLAFSDQVADPIHPPLPAHEQQLPKVPMRAYPISHPLAGIAAPPPLPRYTWSTMTLRDVFR